MENQENNINKEEIKNKKPRKIGRITFGITMILFGISLFVGSVTSIDILKYILMVWPLVFVSLGIEILYFSKKEDIKYDVVSMILVFVILIFGSLFGMLNYGVNKILYNKDIEDSVISNVIDEHRTYFFDDKVNITSAINSKLKAKITVNKDYENTIVTLKLKVKETEKNMLSLFTNKYSYHNFVDINYSEKEEESNNYYGNVNIFDLPNWLDDIEIEIYTNDINNVHLIGNIELIES